MSIQTGSAATLHITPFTQVRRRKIWTDSRFLLRALFACCCPHYVFHNCKLSLGQNENYTFCANNSNGERFVAPFSLSLFCTTSFIPPLFSQFTNWKLHRERERERERERAAAILTIAIPCVFPRLLNCTLRSWWVQSSPGKFVKSW